MTIDQEWEWLQREQRQQTLNERTVLFNFLLRDNRARPMTERLAKLHDHGFRVDEIYLRVYDKGGW